MDIPDTASASAAPHFWLAHVRLGLAMSTTVIVMATVYLAMTPDHPNAAALGAVLGLAALFTLVMWRLPWQRLIERGLAVRVMHAWSLALVPMVVLVTHLDGGSSSPLALVIALPLIYAGMAYPVRATLGVGAAVVVGQVIIAAMGTDLHTDQAALQTAVQLTVLVLITVMAARIASNHGRALTTSQELAGRLGALAHVDGLTGCLNHRGFHERLDVEVAAALRHHRPLALLQVDLDHFKWVNDSFGHPVGDRMLSAVGATLMAGSRTSDAVGRIGGEEFAVLLPDTDLARAEEIAERFRAAVGQLDGPVHITASVGVSALPEVVDSLETLVPSADQALYVAKREGRDRVAVATRDTSGRVVAARLETSAVTTVLAEGGTAITSVFQPIVGVADGVVRGFEALSRIDGSNVPPDRWLTAAQQEGRRCELELAMLDAAVRAHADTPWSAGVPLFLNVGPDLLATSQLWDRLDQLPAGTVFELSERLVLSESAALASAAKRWVEAGVQLAIDDLGAGYANLRAVLELEPAFVKLDCFLVQELDQRPNHRALVASLVTFAAQMGTTIVAEGVERPEELWTLADLGVPLAQGYGLARPAEVPPAVTWSARPRALADAATVPARSPSPTRVGGCRCRAGGFDVPCVDARSAHV